MTTLHRAGRFGLLALSPAAATIAMLAGYASDKQSNDDDNDYDYDNEVSIAPTTSAGTTPPDTAPKTSPPPDSSMSSRPSPTGSG